jgi:nicotinamide-nucleotide amidase
MVVLLPKAQTSSQHTCLPPELIDDARKTLKSLKAHNLSAVTAESCTAGLVSAALAHAEGAGDLLHGGFVTYTKAAKHRFLDVSKSLLSREGSVSPAIATGLAVGALRHSPADIAIAVTGVLGPEPDEDGNPVGLIYAACARRGHSPTVRRLRFHKDVGPTALRILTVQRCLAMLRAEARRRPKSA